ncbi:uncharacterized protein LOC110242367 [Exaiptasia diaphana]|uniref:Uncharacterized protein n=1 Tax=Exaiptasia diaphana TaxID=2652724 RepID=A0A913XGE6_EXADI|nr:uncharacterized protein LOC110242367 [Exaiptasia diaphana]
MKIICAGLSKTGTKSLAKALRILGFVVHDFEEHFMWHMSEYIQALNGDMLDFTAMYSQVDAVTDTPACLLWKELSQTFPDAKVVLMERDSAEIWVQSLLSSFAVYRREMCSLKNILGSALTPTGRKRITLMGLVYKKMHGDQDKEGFVEFYIEHNARVNSTIPRDKLLVYNVKQGWEPLCEFLGVPVPDVPFPRLNVKDQLIPNLLNSSEVAKRMLNELLALFVILVVLIAAIVAFLINL